MIYPPFLAPGSPVGVCAPSAGLEESDLPGFERSLRHLKKRGWTVRETASVRSGALPSASGPVRAREFNDLARDRDIRAILCASGGDFLVEMLPWTDLNALREDPKWVQGYSDPTGLLFPLVTKYDVACIYGPNAGGYDMEPLHPSLEKSLDILSGNLPAQESFSLYAPLTAPRQPDGSYALQKPVRWHSPAGDLDLRGRLLGGCLDVIDILRGTDFIDVPGFVRRYAADGVLWFFDVFAMTAEQVFYSLWSMNQAGWFDHARGVLLGRVAFPGGSFLDYPEAVRRALGEEIPCALEGDIGHVPPKWTLMCGAMGHFTLKNSRARLEMELKP